MHHYTTEDIIEGIRDRKDCIIDYVYDICYPDIRKLVLMNNGNEQDARDVFQEALCETYHRISRNGLNLSCQFKSYIYSVCRLLWLKELKERSRKDNTSDELSFSPHEKFEDDEIEKKKLNIFQKHFSELSRICQKILSMYFRNVSMEEICEVMGYSNIQVARDKKYRCKQSLLTRIYNNPEYQKLKNEIHLAS